MFQVKIFDGNIFIFENFPLIKNTLKIYNLYFMNFFKISLDDFLNKPCENIKNLNEKFSKIQDKVKENKSLCVYWADFLKKLGFELSDIFCDKICIRFNPKISQFSIGTLKPAIAHRDTWASNLYHQINWWMPLHNVQEENSIFIAPYYLKKSYK
mgnify:CR=1 FL=1